MTSRFELFIAARYLRARRKEAVISMITAISVLGVAAGVMALVIALAVTNGFRNTLERNLLGAMAHINVVPRTPGEGIEQWQELSAKIRKVPHVTAVSPVLYNPTYFNGPLLSKGGILKGVEVDRELALSTTLRKLKAGSVDRLRDANAAMLSRYRARDWDGAMAALDELRQAGTNAGPNCDLDHYVTLYSERIESFRINPPPEGWSGVFEAQTK